MGKIAQPEYALQRTVAQFLPLALPFDAFFTAIDIGTAGSPRAGAARKARGVKAGLPDVLIVWRGVTLWIEIKVAASLSPAQKTIREELRRNGHFWELARSLDDVRFACVAAGIPMRVS